MKILMFKGYNPEFRDDNEIFYEMLKEYGHTVKKITVRDTGTSLCIDERININDYKDYDVLWATFEREIIVALEFNKILKKPLVGHYEWIPPWRTGLESPTIWGYEDHTNDTLASKQFSIKSYKFLFDNYLKCDMKTVPESYCLSTIEKLNNKKIDETNLLNETNKEIKQKFQILVIARLVPHKRLHHIIKALSMVKNPPHLKIIGTGDEQIRLIEMAKKYRLSIEFIGVGDTAKKAKAIQESLFLVNIWGMLPFFEAALFKKPCITYKHPYTQNMLGKMPVKFVENNNIEELANAIQEYRDNPDMVKRTGELAYKSFINNEANIYTKGEAIKRLIALFETVIKK